MNLISNLKLPSPLRTICALLAMLFTLEILLMYGLPYVLPPLPSPFLQNLADAVLLTLFFAPVLHRYIFKPFQDAAVVQKSVAEGILAHVVDGVVMFDDLLVIHSCNSAAERIFGCDGGGLAGKDIREIMGDGFRDIISAMREGSQPETYLNDAVRECEGVCCDGSSVAVELSLSQVQIRGEWIWLGIIREITVRKQEEERTKQALSLLKATLEATNDAIMVRDLVGRRILSNKKFDEMWGFSQEVLATQDDNVMRASVLEQLKDPQGFLELTEKQYLEPELETFHVLYFKDGRVVERYGAPQVIDDKVVGRMICYRDITEHRNLEHQLRHVQKMEALGTLAGSVAHDFNNILTVIMGFCNLTAVQLDQEGILRHNLDQIMAASDRALTLTNSLLVYSRKQPMSPVPLELNGTVKNTQKFLARLLGEEIELQTRLSDEKMVVLADRGQIEQVLMNLSANARDAMSGKGRLSIATCKIVMDQEFVRATGFGRPGPFALISVSDTGYGMSEQTREKIFEPFFTTKELGEGTGLGLSIVYGIVTQHQGYINVSSDPGRGSTFNIYLPVIDGVEDAAQVTQQKASGGSETILLAEDDTGVRTLLKSILTCSGYRVIAAEDGEDAVAKFRECGGEVDLLILDVVMPRKNGKEALLEMRALSPEKKVIFISGYTADIIDRDPPIPGDWRLISKPLLPNQLLAQVREVLDGCSHPSDSCTQRRHP